MKKILFYWCTFIISSYVGIVSGNEIHLLTRVTSKNLPSIELSPRETEYLKHKKTLVLGIPPHESPPYGMYNIRSEYEGLNADYAAIISNLLDIPVQVKRYKSLKLLRMALSNGDVDFIPSLNVSIYSDRFIMTQPFASEKPVLGINITKSNQLPDNLENTDIALVRDYLPLSLLEKKYPQTRFKLYNNYQDALSSVAFGDTDAYLGNSYSLNRNFLNNLRMTRFSKLPIKDIGFVLNRNQPELLALINKALRNIPNDEKHNLLRFWQPDMVDITQSTQQLEFTEKERAWIDNHPTVDVVLYAQDKAAPVTIIDNTGTLRGIAGDLLSVIGIKTGLRFRFTTVDSTSELLNKIQTLEADMLASLTPSKQRSQNLLFTRPYLRSAFAITTNVNNDEIYSLEDLNGKKLALVKHTGIENKIRELYPDIKIVPVENETELMNAIINHNADAAVSILIMADYQIKTYYKEQLKIVSVVGSQQAWISFGISKNHPVLQSILDKVLLSIPPMELENLANRWRPSDFVMVDKFWSRYRDVFISSLLFSGVIIISTILWVIYLRIQIRRKAELRRQLNDQLNQLRAVITSIPCPVFLVDQTGVLTFCNQRYLDEMGETYDNILGKTAFEIQGFRTHDQAYIYHDKIMKVIESGVPILEDCHVEVASHISDPPFKKTLYQWLTPWQNGQGGVVGVIGGWIDLSEREALLAELRTEKDRAEASNRAKSAFLSTMSHEIRTPMNAIIGMIDMALKKGRQGIQDLQALEIAYEAADSLVGLIGDILDISRIEGGYLDYNPQPVDINNLIEGLLKVFQGLAIDKNITLTKNLPSEPQLLVFADPLRIKQIISNLLSNAIKFTDSGGVSLTVLQHIDAKKEHVTYSIEVRDTGIGIDKIQQATLFKPFHQADNRRAGTGLGLYISQTICEKMDGTLILESQKGVGTNVTATISLPIIDTTPIEEKPLDDFTYEARRALNILVVDDNTANRTLLSKQLTWLDQKAHLASDAYEALELYRRQSFDIIITDCNMPGINGYQLTQIIREVEEEKGGDLTPVWIIGFTANATQEAIEKCMDSGMNNCLFKPCSINSLVSALNSIPDNILPVGFDISSAISISEDSEEENRIRETMRDLMIETLRDDLEKLANFNIQDNSKSIASLVHRIAGSLRIFHKKALADACIEIENLCLHADPMNQDLQDKFTTIQSDLNNYLHELESTEERDHHDR